MSIFEMLKKISDAKKKQLEQINTTLEATKDTEEKDRSNESASG